MLKQQDSVETNGKYASYMKDIFENPMVERFQKRKTRRLLVTGMFTWFLVTNVVAFTFPNWIWVWGALFLGFFPLASMINMSVRGVTEIPLAVLDERQAELKSKAYLSAYYLGIVLALILGFALAKLMTSGPHVLPLMGGGVGMLFGLPAMMLAWRLPDEVDSEA